MLFEYCMLMSMQRLTSERFFRVTNYYVWEILSRGWEILLILKIFPGFIIILNWLLLRVVGIISTVDQIQIGNQNLLYLYDNSYFSRIKSKNMKKLYQILKKPLPYLFLHSFLLPKQLIMLILTTGCAIQKPVENAKNLFICLVRISPLPVNWIIIIKSWFIFLRWIGCGKPSHFRHMFKNHQTWRLL